MTIYEKPTCFKELNVGDIFCSDTDFFLKINKTLLDEKNYHNAVNLIGNYTTYFEDDEWVTPKDGQLTIY